MADYTGDGLGAPASHWFLITANDSIDLEIVPRAILIGTAGNLACHDIDGHLEVLPVIAGYNPIRPKRVLSTNTTASGIYGLY